MNSRQSERNKTVSYLSRVAAKVDLMPKKCEIEWLAAGDLTLSTRPESRRGYEACQSDSKMQDQLKRDEKGITLSAYTMEKLSRSMWNKPEARSRHQLWFWEIQLRMQ